MDLLAREGPSSSLPNSFRVPLKGLPCDVGNGFPESVADPFPFSTSDGDFHPLLLGVLPQVIIFAIFLGQKTPRM